MRTSPLLALFLLLPAAAAANDCVAYGSQMCWYAGKGVNANEATVLVYFRGHWGDYGGNVPADQRLAGARSAFKTYELKRVADDNKVVVLVTGSSDVSVSDRDLEKVAEAAKVTVASRWLASHSGGFVGLGASLKKLGYAGRIIMLDTFYFGEDLSKDIAARVAKGAVCTGFTTPHNKKRWSERFAPHVPEKSCPINHYNAGSEHEDAVRRCLAPYLSRTTCL